jgi:YwiC-like protein
MNSYSPTSTADKPAPKVLPFPQPAATKKLLVPREHGSWGLWLLPLITGAVVAAADHPGRGNYAIFWFCAASAAAFLAYQPLEALLGISAVKARTPEEKQLAATWVILSAFVATVSALQLLLSGRGRVLLFALLAAACFGIRMLFGKVRGLRATRQILGALALSSSAAAAYYVVAGEIAWTAFVLWAACWVFAAAQIEYVQLRMHTAGVRSCAEKARAGWKVYLIHALLVLLTTIAAIAGHAPGLFALLFIPAMARLIIWTLRRPQKIDFYALGFSELFQSVLFTCLLIVSFLWQ